MAIPAPSMVGRQALEIEFLKGAHAFECRDLCFVLLKKIGRAGILIKGPSLKLLDPDSDQVARDVVAFGETVECLARNEVQGDLSGAMHAGFAQFAAFDQDTVDNRASVAAGKLDVPVLALGGEKSFGTTLAAVMRFAANDVEEGWSRTLDTGSWKRTRRRPSRWFALSSTSVNNPAGLRGARYLAAAMLARSATSLGPRCAIAIDFLED
jgi:hypothetical protein